MTSARPGSVITLGPGEKMVSCGSGFSYSRSKEPEDVALSLPEAPEADRKLPTVRNRLWLLLAFAFAMWALAVAAQSRPQAPAEKVER